MRELMGIVCAALGWTPATFWESTPHELEAIIDARREMNEQADG